MAHRGLAHPDQQGEVADTQFLREAEGMQDPGTVRIGEQPEYLRDAFGIREGEHLVQKGRDVLWMQTLGLASLPGKLDN